MELFLSSWKHSIYQENNDSTVNKILKNAQLIDRYTSGRFSCWILLNHVFDPYTSSIYIYIQPNILNSTNSLPNVNIFEWKSSYTWHKLPN